MAKSKKKTATRSKKIARSILMRKFSNYSPGLKTTMATPGDRMMRYRRERVCPECGASPVICIMRRPDYACYRCRQCGHRWEINWEVKG